MKKKWLVSFWSEAKERTLETGFDNYEEAITFKYKVEKRFNRRAEIKLRDAK